jgi:hypothetical protein
MSLMHISDDPQGHSERSVFLRESAEAERISDEIAAPSGLAMTM